MNAVFEKRISEFKSRLLKKKYEYRQFDTANGIWLKLRIAVAAANKIIGLKDVGANEIIKVFPLTKIGILSSLNNREKIFFSSLENLNFSAYKFQCAELNCDLQELLKSDYDNIIFIFNC